MIDSRPKVRASSATIGAIVGPTAGSRTRFRSSRAKAIVVDTAWPPDPASRSAKTFGSGALGALGRTTREGTGPFRIWRRAIRYWCASEPSGGR